MQRVGRQVGGVELARAEPAELVGDRVRAHARGVEHGAPRTSVTAAEPAAVIVPQPDASNPAAATRSPSTRSEIRIRSPQAAPPARAVKGVRRALTTPGGMLEMLAERLHER